MTFWPGGSFRVVRKPGVLPALKWSCFGFAGAALLVLALAGGVGLATGMVRRPQAALGKAA